jgi:nucleotide-binding universal stress UspA family protein
VKMRARFMALLAAVVMVPGVAAWAQEPAPGVITAGDDVQERGQGRLVRVAAQDMQHQGGDEGTQELKVRIQSIGRRQFTADVAGRKRTFRVERESMLGRFEEGDLVIIRVDADDIVVGMRGASVRGRLVRVDRRRKELVVDVNGREEAYGVQDREMLEDLRVGDRIRFEFEERNNGRKVVTKIE